MMQPEQFGGRRAVTALPVSLWKNANGEPEEPSAPAKLPLPDHARSV